MDCPLHGLFVSNSWEIKYLVGTADSFDLCVISCEVYHHTAVRTHQYTKMPKKCPWNVSETDRRFIPDSKLVKTFALKFLKRLKMKKSLLKIRTGNLRLSTSPINSIIPLIIVIPLNPRILISTRNPLKDGPTLPVTLKTLNGGDFCHSSQF